MKVVGKTRNLRVTLACSVDSDAGSQTQRREQSFRANPSTL